MAVLLLLLALGCSSPPPANQLKHETSPYLLQHANNPVAWYPWGPEAFQRAEQQDKPILLSIGYSTCHWCHVMERESFADHDVAAVLNEHFVAVKVDREERPDVDQLYLTANLLENGRAGWPQTLLLTPDQKPFFAGTYLPKADLLKLLNTTAQGWTSERSRFQEMATHLTQRVRDHLETPTPGTPDPSLVDHTRRMLLQAPPGRAPLFPPHQELQFLQQEGAHDAARAILDAMAAGGIRDHLGGGFHRYSTDARWHRPHFEKMLYDNAQLLKAYALAGKADVAEEIAGWLERELSDPKGGFYSALDADERYYTWTAEELGSENARLFGVEGEEPQVLDPVEPVPAGVRDQLLRRREQRPKPALDDKVITAWNGLALGGLVAAGKLDRARKTADFLLTTLRTEDGLFRIYRNGKVYQPAFLEDYAFLADGLLDLHEATAEDRWLTEAQHLAHEMERRFKDPKTGLYDAGHKDLIAPVQPAFDSALPSAAGVAARVFVRLDMADRAEAILANLWADIERRPTSRLSLVSALALLSKKRVDAEAPGVRR